MVMAASEVLDWSDAMGAAQAEERADTKRMNKGRESMEAALEMIQLLAPPPGAPRVSRRTRPKLRKGKR